MLKKTTLTLMALALGAMPVAVHAGLTDKEKALWGASTDAPTTFSLPAGGDTAVMAKAGSLLADWATLDRYMYAMPVRTHTATLIQTQDPTQLNEVGFKVLDTRTAGGSVITIDVSSFEGKILQVSQQRRDANKRAHLLAYLLEQSAGVQPPSASAPAPAPVAPATAPAASPVNAPTSGTAFDPYLQQLRSQLDGRQYDAAMTTLNDLRAAIAGQAKAKH